MFQAHAIAKFPEPLLQTPLQKLGGTVSHPEHSSKNQGGNLRRENETVTRKGYQWA